ncbi:cell division protein FtsI (penicillin-binding protein 3) [Corynebacterium mucifaciens]|uniref:Cell division protein FtsI (Penicillin-binding protein 3) n=1 Tax=Corynebacterium mucifaciens TaxID=57171 RepID=A0A7X6LR53_9CORY|nr:penicillin-binding protein 2 [Corynebacterium mucifaciens]
MNKTGGNTGVQGTGPRRGQPSSQQKAPVSQKRITGTRVYWLGVAFLAVAALLIGRLFWVQVIIGDELREQANDQRSRTYVDRARRGEIVDRDGNTMAYTMQARSLTVSPVQLRSELKEQQELELRMDGLSDADIAAQVDARVEDVLRTMANEIPGMIGDGEVKGDAPASTATGEPTTQVGQVSAKEILDKLHADSSYEVLVRNVDPDVAATVADAFHGIAADHQDIRQYPNGAVGENIIGKVSMDGQGQFGLEAARDADLTGIDGRSTEDVSAGGQSIPGSLRDVVPAVEGSRIELTIDLDLQTYVQQTLEQAKANSQAKDAQAVVLDAHTGEVLAMANTGTINPNGNIEQQLKQGKGFENPNVSHPFEPGSVAKVITAAAAIDQGLTDPYEVHQVPGSIDMAGITVRDAWEHGVMPYTTAGIFAKSSNVGTLQLVQRLGEERYWDYLNRFGIGQSTGVELPNESSGLLPVLEQWSGGTFANLPIGQGMSWTALQMAGVYQALANDGERIQPRIISSITGPDGEEIPQPAPERTRVVSPEAARTTVDMFRATFQEDPAGVDNGTAQGNSVEGYQFSGKTGTAQKVNPDTGAYSQSAYWITFAGIAPADDPRFVVAVMLDEPQRGVLDGGAGGQSAAPVFKQIAGWLLNRENVPLSPPAEPYRLQGE